MISYPGLVKNYASYFDTPAKKNYLNLGITLVTLMLLILMIYPAILYIFEINSELKQNREVNTALTQKIQALDQAESQMENLRESLSLIDESLPDKAEVGEYLQQVESQLQSAAAVISNLQVEETPISTGGPNPAQIVTVGFNLTLNGSFENLQIALDQLEKLNRFTDIQSANFSSSQDESGSLKLVLKAKTYFYGSADLPTPIAPGAAQ